MITGVLTIGLLGGVGAVLISEGAWLIGSVAIGFAVLRLVLFIIQVVRWVQSRNEPEPDVIPASDFYEE